MGTPHTRYGIVLGKDVDSYHDDGCWFIIHGTQNLSDWGNTKWIHLDDAMTHFDISPVVKRFGAWAVTEWGVEHFASHTKISSEHLYNHDIDNYCGRKLGYWEKDFDNALEHARRHFARNPKPPKVSTTKPMPTQPQHVGAGVYLLFCNGHYKIGRGENVLKRIRQIQTNAPFKVEHIHTIATPTPADLERTLHARFASKRVRGEWFALTDSDVAYIRSL